MVIRTERHDDSTDPAPLGDAPAALIGAAVALFNARDTAGLNRLHHPEAVMVPAPGAPVTGERRTAALVHLVSLGLRMRAEVRQAYRGGDSALLLVEWSLRGTGPGGAPMDLSGTATDVVRRGPDGRRRYAVDNPFGAGSPPPA
ncbi:DUF4440 domain-containing protein [Nocardiopsis sp. CNT-189]|uniref:YybH family protein n=1 Tax=Nocardiopsis oceanisediminis TaxID=2816862 RepID=UPI003B2E2D78